jgi:hypothetical protein
VTWVPALVTGGLAFLAAAITAVLSWSGQRRADNKNKERDERLAQTTQRLAELNDRLSRQAAEESARRAYEYEARQRLYVQIQPLLFQMGELCETSYDRIASLQQARLFRHLEFPGYVMLSTIHRLVCPLVVVRQIQRRLTAVDLGVDSIVRGQYLVAKEIARTLTSGVLLAETEPQLDYRWKTDADRQHIGIGELEMLITLLTVREPDGTPRWMDYGELEASYQNDAKAQKIINQVQIPLLRANPLTKPVLWRTLVAQAYLQWAMIGMIEGTLARPASWEPPGAAKVFNWATRSTPLPEAADPESARSAALNYATARLQKRLDSITAASGK